LAPNEFWQFPPPQKSSLKGRKFQGTEDIQRKKKKSCDDGTESYSTRCKVKGKVVPVLFFNWAPHQVGVFGWVEV
jgi:hypothetical protein